MAKLYFNYSSMNAGKSTMLLQANHNYIERGMQPEIYTSNLDKRFGESEIVSRIGLKSKSNLFDIKTNIYKENGFAYIDKEITDKKFRIFIFYGLSKNGTRRSGDFNFQVNHSIDDAHIVVQEPLVANNFIFSEQNHEDFKDQHGINFKRIHLRGYIANSAKNITFTYDNPTQDISINALQKGAQAPQNVSTPQNTGPIRHKLPLWQPLAALGVVSIVIGGMFYRQMSTESSAPNPAQPKGKFCTECGNKILPKNKFCSNCGAKV